MSEVCSERVADRMGWGSHLCGRKASVEDKGRWYCGTHDPSKRRARQERHSAIGQAERDYRGARQALIKAILEQRPSMFANEVAALEEAHGRCQQRGVEMWRLY